MNVLKRNLQYIWKCWLKCIAFLATALSVVFVVVSWEDMGIRELHMRIWILVGICFVMLLGSVLYACVLKRQRVIWQNASGRIIVRYADILKEGFNVKNKKERLYVIPVNSAFDTIVDADISLCGNPLISPNSLHGKWVMRMIENGINLECIDQAIDSCLKKQNKAPLSRGTSERVTERRGKQDIYDLGTIAVVKGNGKNIFLLLALTNLDENNNAYTTVKKLTKTIKRLINFYDQHGQGYELVIPLMGTNFSRAGLTHDDSLRIITSMLRIYGDQLHGDVSVVINTRDKDKVTIDF